MSASGNTQDSNNSPPSTEQRAGRAVQPHAGCTTRHPHCSPPAGLDAHFPLILIACCSAIQESTTCTPTLLMLGCELRTLCDLAFGKLPDSHTELAGLEYASQLQNCLEVATASLGTDCGLLGHHQKQHYATWVLGPQFDSGDLVWVVHPRCRRGHCPKLDSVWTGLCKVLERLREVTYRV